MTALGVLLGGYLFAAPPSVAQNNGAVAAPDDLTMSLAIEGGGERFRWGELIPIEYSFRANTPDKYLWIPNNKKLEGGRAVEVSCSPAVEATKSISEITDVGTYRRVLFSPCGGVGGSGASGCGDCDNESPLNASPLRFSEITLNRYIHFRQPGTYTCTATSAELTADPKESSSRRALLVTSNPIVVTIVDDPSWAQSSAQTLDRAYTTICGSDPLPQDRLLQCFALAPRIMYLDTTDSLAIEVKWLDGRSHTWDNGFWDAVRHSSHPEEALRLMTARIQESDFVLTENVLTWLASLKLTLEASGAFYGSRGEPGHALAVESLRTYVRIAGSSLATKRPDTMASNTAAYRAVAEGKYCDQLPLIPAEEIEHVLAGVANPN